MKKLSLIILFLALFATTTKAQLTGGREFSNANFFGSAWVQNILQCNALKVQSIYYPGYIAPNNYVLATDSTQYPFWKYLPLNADTTSKNIVLANSSHTIGGGVNIGIGDNAGKDATGILNFFCGISAGNHSNSSGCHWFGNANGYESTLETSIVIGNGAADNSTGAGNYIFGTDAADDAQSVNNIIIGNGAGEASIGNNNVMLGTNAGLNFDGQSSYLIGTNAGEIANLVGGYAIGNGAAKGAFGINNSYYGNYAGINTNANYCTYIGDASGYGNTKNAIIFIGHGGDTNTSWLNGRYTSTIDTHVMTMHLNADLLYFKHYRFPTNDGTANYGLGTNGAGVLGWYRYLTTETDPTIYAWAKATTKPSYTYSEVGAQVAGNYYTASDTTSTLLTKSKATNLYQTKRDVYLPFFVQMPNYATLTANAAIYFGNNAKSATTTAGRNKVYIRQSGTITSAELYSYCITAAGTNENISVYIRLNNTTDYLVQTVGSASAERIFSNTGLDIAVVAGDYFEIKMVTPASFSTAPQGFTIAGNVYLKY